MSTVTTAILHRTPWIPPVAVSAHRSTITLVDGREILDGVGGAAVTSVGMGHPAVLKAIKEQVDKVSYVYNMQLSSPPAEELAKYLVDTSNGAFNAVGLVSGGSEAMEGVIKLAQQYFFETNQPKRTNFIARKQSYHGNTIATLSLGHHPARRAPYVGLMDEKNFHHVSPAYKLRYAKPGESDEEYVARLKAELEAKFEELGGDTVIGFVAETVVGATSGVTPAPPGYFKAMKEVCEKYGALFILDEVMSGMGRMGTLHAWESFGDGAQPDIQAIAKGLGGGYAAIGAVLMNKRVTDGIRDSNGFWKHGHTYQAQPLGCAASLAVQKVIRDENLLENARERGKQLQKLLVEGLTGEGKVSKPFIAEIRGGGCFWGIEFELGPKDIEKLGGKRLGGVIQEVALKNGLVIIGMSGGIDGQAGEHCILAPAYNVNEEEVAQIAKLFIQSVEESIQPLL